MICTIDRPPKTEGQRPSTAELIWRITLTPERALTLLADLTHMYPNVGHRPRVGGMLEMDGQVTLYLWPRIYPGTPLLLFLTRYGAVLRADLTIWHGQCFITEPLLSRVLARLAVPRLYHDLSREVGAGIPLLPNRGPLP